MSVCIFILLVCLLFYRHFNRFATIVTCIFVNYFQQRCILIILEFGIQMDDCNTWVFGIFGLGWSEKNEIYVYIHGMEMRHD